MKAAWLPPNKKFPQAGRPRRHKGDREPPKDKKLPHAANAVQPTKETSQPGGDKKLTQDSQRGMTPKGDCAAQERPKNTTGGHGTARKGRRAARNQKLPRIANAANRAAWGPVTALRLHRAANVRIEEIESASEGRAEAHTLQSRT